MVSLLLLCVIGMLLLLVLFFFGVFTLVRMCGVILAIIHIYWGWGFVIFHVCVVLDKLCYREVDFGIISELKFSVVVLFNIC